MKLFMIGLSGLLMSFSVIATELVLPLGSYHINSAREFNERNYGVGVRFQDIFELGIFRNSYYKITGDDANGNGYSPYFKATVYDLPLTSWLDFRADVGVAMYGNDGHLPVMPIVLPNVRLHYDRWSTTIGFYPTFANTEGENGETSTMRGVLTWSTAVKF